MHLILCVDDRGGLSFAGRRLSTDRKLTEKIVDMAEYSKLWIEPYSEKLFEKGNIFVSPDYLNEAASGEYCFLEREIQLVPKERLESIILCRWNRAYPSTEKFPRELLVDMRLVHTEDFPGNSHEKITIERHTP